MDNYNKLLGNLIMRSFTAVPAHLSFACLMAPFLYFAIKDKEYGNKHYSVGGVFLGIQLGVTFILLYWFVNDSSNSETFWFHFLKISCFFFFIILLIELAVFLINPQSFKIVLKYNFKLGMLMIAVVLPSFLHTLHNWSLSRFDGRHLLITYLSLFFTYVLIITYTSFTIESDQPDLTMLHPMPENIKKETSQKDSSWEKQSS